MATCILVGNIENEEGVILTPLGYVITTDLFVGGEAVEE